MPSSARPVPDHTVLPSDGLAAVKARARRAWQDARKRKAAPVPLLDRWYSDALTASTGAPEVVQIVFAHRTELLFKLLLDRQRWFNQDEG